MYLLLALILTGGTVMSPPEWDPHTVPVFQELWDYGHPSESEARFRSIEDSVQKTHPALHAELL
ncbi:MAG: hypothetical protein HKN20_16105, partial [Gemmatimonadetes bacterium]|nr:hypothetical protein [Gemmatimonadota bacterium]